MHEYAVIALRGVPGFRGEAVPASYRAVFGSVTLSIDAEFF